MSEEPDIYGDVSPPRHIWLFGVGVSVAVFVAVAAVSSSSAPFLSTLVVAVITILIALTWHLRDRWLLWFMLALILAGHIGILVLLPLPAKTSYGMAFTPLVGIEVYALYRIVIAILRISDQRHHDR